MNRPEKKENPNKIKHLIGVMSGKGGVGKSTVTYLTALALKQKGYRVGILDADITGASIPRIMHLPKYEMKVCGDFICPVETDQGLKVMSISFLVDNEEQPVIWRGPLLSKAIQQFWGEVLWGEPDYLVIDMPPGTSDVAITVMQSFPIHGFIFVTTPQDLVSVVVARSMQMAERMKVPVLGLVENMSYFICPHCGQKTNFFSPDETEKLARQFGTELLVQIPISLEFARMPSHGLDFSSHLVQEILNKLGQAIAQKLA
ncbi:MAG: Mrp/NBP35 family ATP-binding protein [Candidatus Saccharicenans sp.]|uniref:Mrp/NBP35 family ATP-binding protein n=1 Tax=Candidatus Saccharicenans sp. TaxID=2819258 RepID=UPI004049523F